MFYLYALLGMFLQIFALVLLLSRINNDGQTQSNG